LEASERRIADIEASAAAHALATANEITAIRADRQEMREMLKIVVDKIGLVPAPAEPEAVDNEALEWLSHTSREDVNFKHHLETANAATLRAALKDEGLAKTKRTKIEAMLRKREQEQK
ncbi:MAG: hypothetical protein WAW41_13415, partial [Methylobacter sp.]